VVGGHRSIMEISSVAENELTMSKTTSLTSSPCVELEAVEYTTQETTTVSFMTGHGPKRNFERVQGSWLWLVWRLPATSNSALRRSNPRSF
jgi:hypothetical protein